MRAFLHEDSSPTAEIPSATRPVMFRISADPRPLGKLTNTDVVAS
jgi:hypothetical protein